MRFTDIQIRFMPNSRQYRHREGVEMAEDGATVSSRQYQRYEFDARASAPYTLDDRLFTVSMHLNVSRVSGEKFKGRCAGNVIVSLRLSSVSYLDRLGPVYPTKRRRQ